MRLIHNWKAVLRYAWSIRFLVLAAVLSGVEVALPLVVGVIPIPAGIFAALSFVTVAAAFIARIIAQKEISDG
ncbi:MULTISPECIES: hypothetical protein [Nitratireductor]|uniref:DUF7940 domain-containing protein n=1 Tax=Nitratireductor TaxID=245876 RepID=UPI0019D3F9D1|nr:MULTISPECIES: hypothetical protein [Nitratireductor]MBN7764066.1 hypothetical protein [Nitratireductor aquibiodomus]MBN7778885.1 hypothetical protein [Nitratireductor pacificus]MBN7783222.1 hypothetical protein [Nitratireductor pacificus]MBN7792023.1 hypothetical protein [Nitratireductor aquimarinus]MBY6101237.1 hypothetical protein [Nitratireductor aquimarinus]